MVHLNRMNVSTVVLWWQNMHLHCILRCTIHASEKWSVVIGLMWMLNSWSCKLNRYEKDFYHRSFNAVVSSKVHHGATKRERNNHWFSHCVWYLLLYFYLIESGFSFVLLSDKKMVYMLYKFQISVQVQSQGLHFVKLKIEDSGFGNNEKDTRTQKINTKLCILHLFIF